MKNALLTVCLFLRIAIGFSLSWSPCDADDAEEMDVYELEVAAIEAEESLGAVEEAFEEITEIRGLLRNSRHCFRYVTNEELKRLHRLAPLSREEFLQVETDLRFSVRKTVLEICQDRLWRSRLHNLGSPAGNSHGRLAPVTHVENFVLEAVSRHLPKERWAVYRQDVEDRRLHRQTSLVSAITASLDSRLFLSAEQRESVADLLQREWHDPWLLCIRQLMIRGVEVIPLLPRGEIQELLTPAQRELFSKLTWSPVSPPYVGPSDATMAGHEQADVRLVDQLRLKATERGGSP